VAVRQRRARGFIVERRNDMTAKPLNEIGPLTDQASGNGTG
jgi:hypothetical protein